MSLAKNTSPPARILLNALLELRRLGKADAFCSSKRFRSYMHDLRPDLKREADILSKLIAAGFVARLQKADADERAAIAEQIRRWLDKKLHLKNKTAQLYSSVLLAFCSGENNVPAIKTQPAAARTKNQSAGGGLKQDRAQIAYWYRQAVWQGDADAQFNLGVCCSNGQIGMMLY